MGRKIVGDDDDDGDDGRCIMCVYGEFSRLA